MQKMRIDYVHFPIYKEVLEDIINPYTAMPKINQAQ